MYVRIVLGKLRWGTWHQYERHYHDRVAPSTIRGLRERQLLRGIDNPDEGISLSVWDTRETLHDYEVSDARSQLAQEVEHLYQPWSPSRSEYLVKHFELLSRPIWSELQGGYLRIVWGKLSLGLGKSMRSTIRNGPRPTVPGACRAASSCVVSQTLTRVSALAYGIRLTTCSTTKGVHFDRVLPKR